MKKEAFKDIIEKKEKIIKEFSTRSKSLSTLRITLFLITLVGVIYFSNEKSALVVFMILLVFLIIFSITVRFHNRVNFRLNHARFIKKINEEEICRLNNKFGSIYKGEEYKDEEHPYSSDLDVFGDNSLFQLLNRSGTHGGRSLMADWLLKGAAREEISERQEAVIEMEPDTEWRQNFQASSMHFRNSSGQIDVCLSWMEEKDLISKDLFIRGMGILSPVANLVTIILFLTGSLHYLFPIMTAGLSAWVFGMVHRKMGDTFKKTADTVDILSSYHLMIQMIEERKMNTAMLRRIRETFESDQVHASGAIRQLKTIFTALETRSNVLYLIVDILLLLDIFWLLKAERWRRKNRDHIKKWFRAIHELEAICGLAGFSYANPEFCMPELTPDTGLQANQLGHPLIPVHERVRNDFDLGNKDKIGIITGSNMSGKSTFLRTVGVNLLLAFCGAPVCSTSFRSGIFSMYSSMRTHDSLKDHVSSFYAELKRLKSLIVLVEENSSTTFFLLDEILKGTNSHDRHKGARALIRQLLEENCKGLVSTHDLELSDIEKEDSRILNLSFNSSLKEDEVIFDYKLKQGVCNSFNATQLMEKMGIKIRE